MKDQSVSVAMCTYNGSRFLYDQLMSLMNQSQMPAELVVCDDASTDSTVEIVKSFARNAPFEVHLYQNSNRKGLVDNYSQAISLCKEKYIALSDQDDIWLPEKLSITLEKMINTEKKIKKNLPVLVHTDLSLIDNAGKIKAESLMKLSRFRPIDEEPLKRLIAQNFVTGCTILINRSLIEAALPIPEEAVFHDWWLALVVAAKGKRVFEPRSTVLYRQHDGNVLGAKRFLSKAHFESAGSIKSIEKSMAGSIKQASALKRRLQELPDSKAIPYLDQYIDAAFCSGIRTASVAMRHGIKRMGLLRNFLFLFLLIKGDYLNLLIED